MTTPADDKLIEAATHWAEALAERARLQERLGELDRKIAQYQPIVAALLGPAADVPVVVEAKKRIRWTPEVIEGTRARYESGEQTKKIAADLGITPQALSVSLHQRFGVPVRGREGEAS